MTGPGASARCLESACDLIRDRWSGQGPGETRIWLAGSGLLCTTVDAGAVTHSLSASWDGVEVRVNCGSAVERPVLLSVSENERYEREGDESEADLESTN